MHAPPGTVNRFVYNFPLVKRLRHNAILELVRSGEITSQEDLMRGLKSRNIAVSQSTLSRDIQELRLAKAGGHYTVVDSDSTVPHSEGSLNRIISEFMVDIDVAQNIVVVKTGPGHASTVSQALDESGWPEWVGSIAGENTVFVVARSTRDAKRLEQRLRRLL
jgi:transcriptional regulator of arginine metabolism